MKEAPALHKVMHGRDVVFVNLCLGSDKDAWLKTVAQMDLQGENYWFDADATQLFLGAYNLSGYPTYILVGKDDEGGAPVHPDAGVPTDRRASGRIALLPEI